jgi:hypothetical protein
VATRTLILKHVPLPLVEAIVDLALAEDRTPTAQAERLLREALAHHGRWPPEDRPSRERAASQLPAGNSPTADHPTRQPAPLAR